MTEARLHGRFLLCITAAVHLQNQHGFRSPQHVAEVSRVDFTLEQLGVTESHGDVALEALVRSGHDLESKVRANRTGVTRNEDEAAGVGVGADQDGRVTGHASCTAFDEGLEARVTVHLVGHVLDLEHHLCSDVLFLLVGILVVQNCRQIDSLRLVGGAHQQTSHAETLGWNSVQVMLDVGCVFFEHVSSVEQSRHSFVRGTSVSGRNQHSQVSSIRLARGIHGTRIGDGAAQRHGPHLVVHRGVHDLTTLATVQVRQTTVDVPTNDGFLLDRVSDSLAVTCGDVHGLAVFVLDRNQGEFGHVNAAIALGDMDVARQVQLELDSPLVGSQHSQFSTHGSAIELLHGRRDCQSVQSQVQVLQTAVIFRSSQEASTLVSLQAQTHLGSTDHCVHSGHANSGVDGIALVQSVGGGFRVTQANQIADFLVDHQSAGGVSHTFDVTRERTDASIEPLSGLGAVLRNQLVAVVLQDGVVQQSANHVATTEVSQRRISVAGEVLDHRDQTDRHCDTDLVVGDRHAGEERFAELVLLGSVQVVRHRRNLGVAVVLVVEVFQRDTAFAESVAHAFHADHGRHGVGCTVVTCDVLGSCERAAQESGQTSTASADGSGSSRSGLQLGRSETFGADVQFGVQAAQTVFDASHQAGNSGGLVLAEGFSTDGVTDVLVITSVDNAFHCDLQLAEGIDLFCVSCADSLETLLEKTRHDCPSLFHGLEKYTLVSIKA